LAVASPGLAVDRGMEEAQAGQPALDPAGDQLGVIGRTVAIGRAVRRGTAADTVAACTTWLERCDLLDRRRHRLHIGRHQRHGRHGLAAWSSRRGESAPTAATIESMVWAAALPTVSTTFSAGRSAGQAGHDTVPAACATAWTGCGAATTQAQQRWPAPQRRCLYWGDSHGCMPAASARRIASITSRRERAHWRHAIAFFEGADGAGRHRPIIAVDSAAEETQLGQLLLHRKHSLLPTGASGNRRGRTLPVVSLAIGARRSAGHRYDDGQHQLLRRCHGLGSVSPPRVGEGANNGAG
jgi:hypothetical protein